MNRNVAISPAPKPQKLWYVSEGSQTQGPFNEAELMGMSRAGTLLRTTQISRDKKVFAPAGEMLGSSFFVHSTRAPFPFSGIFSALIPPTAQQIPHHGLDIELQIDPNADMRTTPPPLIPIATSVSVFHDAPSRAEERYSPSRPVSKNDADICMCPHCWTLFPLEDMLYVARHPDLMGDPRLGADAPQRFKATRFTPDGLAIDPGGMISQDVACPMCHLEVPRALVDLRPEFFSIVGAPASGKSYYLASLTWELRQTLARDFAFSFTDAETTMNHSLHQYEEKLFLNADPNAFVGLEKTKLAVGELYSSVNYGGQLTLLPRPFVFTLNAQAHNPVFANSARNACSVVLYDNAGEHFQPGEDTVLRPCQHLIHSRCLFFLLDPTKDPRFRSHIQSSDPQLRSDVRSARQDVLLNEAARRIRRHDAIPQNKKIAKQLVVVVSKYDVWKDLLHIPIRPNPILKSAKAAVAGVDLGHIEDVSFSLRDLLNRICPEFVVAAEEFSSDVTYIPVSALGHSPTECEELAQPGRRALLVRPGDIKPFWATVPFLYALARAGYVCYGSSKPEGAQQVQLGGHVPGYLICDFEDGTTLNVPEHYAGKVIHHPKSGRPFLVPQSSLTQ